MIAPTVGRVVWYWSSYPTSEHHQPCAAIIAFVHNDRRVNLSVIDHDGLQWSAKDVPLSQGDKPVNLVGPFCQWMPYQVGQAKKEAAPAQPLSPDDGTDAAVSLCKYLVANGRESTQRTVTIDGATFDVQAKLVHRTHGAMRAEAVASLRDTEPSRVTDDMVSRFLTWKLPKGFAPDCGVSFDGRGLDYAGHPHQWPVGTNLLDASQARAMLEHVLGLGKA